MFAHSLSNISTIKLNILNKKKSIESNHSEKRRRKKCFMINSIRAYHIQQFCGGGECWIYEFSNGVNCDYIFFLFFGAIIASESWRWRSILLISMMMMMMKISFNKIVALPPPLILDCYYSKLIGRCFRWISSSSSSSSVIVFFYIFGGRIYFHFFQFCFEQNCWNTHTHTWTYSIEFNMYVLLGYNLFVFLFRFTNQKHLFFFFLFKSVFFVTFFSKQRHSIQFTIHIFKSVNLSSNYIGYCLHKICVCVCVWQTKRPTMMTIYINYYY